MECQCGCGSPLASKNKSGYARDCWPKSPAGRKATARANKKWREANPGGVAAATRKWRDAHPGAEKEYKAAWNEKNPDLRRAIHATRRARKADAFVEYVSPSVVFERDSGMCHICGIQVDPKNWHLEHVIPLARGGEHSYANTAASHPLCNLKKGVSVVYSEPNPEEIN